MTLLYSVSIEATKTAVLIFASDFSYNKEVRNPNLLIHQRLCFLFCSPTADTDQSLATVSGEAEVSKCTFGCDVVTELKLTQRCR